MRVALYCSRCDPSALLKSSITWVELREDGIYEWTCPAGHKQALVLQPQRFEVLSELAVSAIIDGYYREAVANFTSSMERFFEFFVKVKLTSMGVDKVHIESFWKEISSQSERQLGAFLFAYVDAFSEPPSLLPRKKIEFRNAVIHKGKLPSKEEAVEYGQAILEVMRPIKFRMKDRFLDSVEELTGQYIWSHQVDPNIPRTTGWVNTLFSLVLRQDQEESVECAVANRKEARLKNSSQ